MTAAPEVLASSELAEAMLRLRDDPLGFVKIAYPWGESGELQGELGPDPLQCEFLRALGAETKARNFDGQNPVMPIRAAIASGHGTGKSAMGAWIANWIMSTRPMSKGKVTAGTFTQLQSATWSAIQTWTRRCITAPWFEVMAGGIFAKGKFRSEWNLIPQTCSPENAQSFAGQHARTSTSWYLFDEASAVPDEVWRVAMGGLTDGEPMFFAWGQPERNTGEFYEICFGRQAERWMKRSWDSRESRLTNKPLIDEWLRDYGEDSDWCRVRIRGLPPRASELQFIDWDRIRAAQEREVTVFPDEPLVAGVDVSGGGAAWNVVRFRRGLDGNALQPIRVPGEKTRGDRSGFLSALVNVLSDRRAGYAVQMMFIDSAFGAAYVERLHTLGFSNVMEVNFGGESLDIHQANCRAYMWNQMREWLLAGHIDPKDAKLADDLAAPGSKLTRSNKLLIESKEDLGKRGIAPIDDADALALTFAHPIGPARRQSTEPPSRGGDWMA